MLMLLNKNWIQFKQNKYGLGGINKNKKKKTNFLKIQHTFYNSRTVPVFHLLRMQKFNDVD